MDQFKHLANLVIEDTPEKKERTSKEKETAKLKGAVIRLYATGEVYPSQDLVQQFNLEYGLKEESANGIDIVDTTEWKPLEKLPRTILFGVTSKNQPKVDLFAQTRYTAEGTPVSSVLTQGTKSKTLLGIARSMGWLTIEKFVDLQLSTETPVTTKDGIAYIPKQVERGVTKGEKTYERRENETFYPVTKVETTTTTNVEETTSTENEVLTINQD